MAEPESTVRPPMQATRVTQAVMRVTRETQAMAGSSRRVRLLWVAGTAAALATTALVACTLNPQPLPPSEMGDGKDGDYDASARSDAGGTGFDRDAATQPPAADAATDAADAGDASDASDAADAGDASDADAW
jgi:hypothetical protein